MRVVYALFFICIFFQSLSSEECHPNCFYVGPTIYHIARIREGGTRQEGQAYGVRVGYDRLGRYKWYLGAEYLYAQGPLYGHGGSGLPIKSTFTDTNIEGRFGYTIQQKCFPRPAFTPFFGGGYSVEKYHFCSPSPIPVHFRLNYSYWCVGFLSHVSITRQFDAGLNFTAKFMIEGKNKATHDPEFEDSTTLVKNRTHFKIELPLTYHCGQQFYISFVPIYEYRAFGHHAGYPFDFLNTRLNIFGATLRLGYCL